MDKLAKKNVTKVIDLLSERLAFERAGVKLYDTLHARLRVATDPTLKARLEQVEHNRDEDEEHVEGPEAQIRALGGDAHARAERSVLVRAEPGSVARVMRRDDGIPH